MDNKKTQRRKKKLGSYPFLSVLFSVTLALLVIGLFSLLLLSTQRITQLIQKNIEIQVFLHKNVTESEKIKIKQIISSKEYIERLDGDPLVTFISKKQAAKELALDVEEDFINIIGDNPLYDSYVIKVKSEYFEKPKLEKMQKDLESISGVFEVAYVEDLIDKINKNTAQISLVLLGLAIILLLIVVILINNTLKLALFSQRFLIRSMQLVGATAGFIQRPFLKRSFFHGILSGIMASLILWGILYYFSQKISDVELLIQPIDFLIVIALITILGGIICFFSSYRAIRKYLKMSLDELF